MSNNENITLSSPVTAVRGIGEKRAKAFEKLGIFTLYDLLSYFPRKYEDRSKTVPIALCPAGEAVCISVIAADEPRLVRVRRGMELVKFRGADESGTVDITYFNQNWMKNNITRGGEYIFYGKMEINGNRRTMANPVYEPASREGTVTGHIVPVYKMCRGLTQSNILQSVRAGLDNCAETLPERLPEEIMQARQLVRSSYAYENIHFPADFQALEKARKRLAYEELFFFSCAISLQRGARTEKTGRRFALPDTERFYQTLPFQPTDAQKRAVRDALQDMSSGKAMNRLVQGDVGSGKTLVAAALIWCAFENHTVSAFMAPTEILAQQHSETLTSLLAPFGIRVRLLTGSMRVAQRSALIGKGEAPHVLVMSATPIPRTLALILYGDLEVSILDEMPPGRQKVDTFLVDSRYRARLNAFIQKQAKEGHQSFAVCPMVEDAEEEAAIQLHAAETYARELQQALPEVRVGCVHGRMKPKEKAEMMKAFSDGETDVLVSTTVVEVGVDVPNATLMIIENAERFGLSQLHQLRGRVGRGKAQSYCVLVSDADNEETRERLNILCRTNDGFKIAEEDLRLRGPGDFFGIRQHGMPQMHVTDLGADTELLKMAKADADSVIAGDPQLQKHENAPLRERVTELLRDAAETWN